MEPIPAVLLSQSLLLAWPWELSLMATPIPPRSDFILTVGRLEELIFDHTVRLIHPSKSGGTNQLDRQINRQN